MDDLLKALAAQVTQHGSDVVTMAKWALLLYAAFVAVVVSLVVAVFVKVLRGFRDFDRR